MVLMAEDFIVTDNERRVFEASYSYDNKSFCYGGGGLYATAKTL